MKLLIALKTVNELNLREHHFARMRRAKEQHKVVRECLMFDAAIHANMVPRGFNRVTITRISSGTMDVDGLHASLKHVMDSVAAWLHPEKIVTYMSKGKLRQNTGQCDKSMEFVLQQRKGKSGEFAVEIEIL